MVQPQCPSYWLVAKNDNLNAILAVIISSGRLADVSSESLNFVYFIDTKAATCRNNITVSTCSALHVHFIDILLTHVEIIKKNKHDLAC